MDDATETPWWDFDAHTDRRPLLRARAQFASLLRAWFAAQGEGFIEVDPHGLVPAPGAEIHLQAYEVPGAGYLHTSPEFAMKKLLAAGERRLFFLGHVWRAGEYGPLHAPEFTMLEWYRVGQSYEVVQRDALTFCRLALQAAHHRVELCWRDRTCDASAEPERLTVSEAFDLYCDIDLTSTLGDADALRRAAARIGFRAPKDETWSDLFSRLLTEKIEPNLGLGRPTLLVEYPIEEAALARPLPNDPRFAERFELYACGVELANGYGELTDAAEQRRRVEAAMAEKERRYGARWPVDEELLRAMAALLPPCSGCALGFDRLLTLATGAPSIAHVQWTPLQGLGPPPKIDLY